MNSRRPLDLSDAWRHCADPRAAITVHALLATLTDKFCDTDPAPALSAIREWSASIRAAERAGAFSPAVAAYLIGKLAEAYVEEWPDARVKAAEAAYRDAQMSWEELDKSRWRDPAAAHARDRGAVPLGVAVAQLKDVQLCWVLAQAGEGALAEDPSALFLMREAGANEVLGWLDERWTWVKAGWQRPGVSERQIAHQAFHELVAVHEPGHAVTRAAQAGLQAVMAMEAALAATYVLDDHGPDADDCLPGLRAAAMAVASDDPVRRAVLRIANALERRRADSHLPALRALEALAQVYRKEGSFLLAGDLYFLLSYEVLDYETAVRAREWLAAIDTALRDLSDRL